MYQNFRLEQPYQHVGFDAAHLTQAVSYTVDEKLKALDRAFCHFFQPFSRS